MAIRNKRSFLLRCSGTDDVDIKRTDRENEKYKNEKRDNA